jgi:hypothetical protein
MTCPRRWILTLIFLGASLVPARGQFAFSNNSGPAVTSSPHLDLDWAEQRAIRQQLKKLADKDAVDCGRARVGQDPSSRTDCALEAFAAKKPFYVLYGVQAFIGFTAQTPDGILELDFGHRPPWWTSTTWSVVAKQTPRHQHFETSPCPTPATLQKTSQGGLTCFSFALVFTSDKSRRGQFYSFWDPL